MCRLMIFAGTCTRCARFHEWADLAQQLSCLEAKNAGVFGRCRRGVQVEELPFDQECDDCCSGAGGGGGGALEDEAISVSGGGGLDDKGRLVAAAATVGIEESAVGSRVTMLGRRRKEEKGKGVDKGKGKEKEEVVAVLERDRDEEVELEVEEKAKRRRSGERFGMALRDILGQGGEEEESERIKRQRVS